MKGYDSPAKSKHLTDWQNYFTNLVFNVSEFDVCIIIIHTPNSEICKQKTDKELFYRGVHVLHVYPGI